MIPSDQVGRAAAIAELELLERLDELLQGRTRHDQGSVPVGLGAIEGIAAEVFDPVVEIHCTARLRGPREDFAVYVRIRGEDLRKLRGGARGQDHGTEFGDDPG